MRTLDQILESELNPYDWHTKSDPKWLPVLQELNKRGGGLAWVPESPQFYVGRHTLLMVLSAPLAQQALTELETSPTDPRANHLLRRPWLRRLTDAHPFVQSPETHPSIYAQYRQGAEAMTMIEMRGVMAEQADAWAEELALRPSGKLDYILMCYEGLARVLAALLGFPVEDAGLLVNATRAIGFGADPYPSEEALDGADRAVETLWNRYFNRLDDPAVQHGALEPYFKAGMTHEQIMERAIWLLTVGIENAAGTLFRLLLRLKASPEQLATLTVLQDKPLLERCRLAVQAGLDTDAAVGFIARFVDRDHYALGDVPLPKGTTILVMPNVVQNPSMEVFDIDARRKKHLYTFGGGEHWCVGEPLARLMVAYLLHSFVMVRLLDRFAPSQTDKVVPLPNAFFLTPLSWIGAF